MELRQLEYVLGIVDHGGFTRAASALHISQPALSQAVRTLEKEIGVDLFVRTGRRVSLTPAGEAFVGPARQALRGVGRRPGASSTKRSRRRRSLRASRSRPTTARPSPSS